MGFLVEKIYSGKLRDGMFLFTMLQRHFAQLLVESWFVPLGMVWDGVDKADGRRPLVCQVVKLKVTFVNFNKLTQRCRGTAMGKCLSMCEHMLLGFCLYTNYLYAK